MLIIKIKFLCLPMKVFNCYSVKKNIKQIEYKVKPITINNKGIRQPHDVIKNRNMRFRDLYEVEKKNVRKFCSDQFETKKDPFWYMCYRKMGEFIKHKIIDPIIFIAIKEVERRINEIITSQKNLDSLNMLFRLEDKKQLFNPKDVDNITNYSLLGICQYIKRVILYDMDGLFPNLVTKKLIRACMSNPREYRRLLSYIPFILSVDEYKLFTRIINLLQLIAKHEEHTHICMVSLLRLFSLSMFNQKAFTSLEVIPITEIILTDIVNLDFDRIPISVFGTVLDVE